MRIALVHDYLMQGIRGAERVLVAIHELYPDAPVYTLLYDPEVMAPLCAGWDVRPSFLQRLPGARRLHQRLAPLMPRATESLPLREYDLVLSASSAWVKSVRTRPDAVHVCFCHSPARFLWHWRDEYLRTFRAGGLSKALAYRLTDRLRRWDQATCYRPTAYIANSRLVQARILEFYGRDSTLIHPPVETDRFLPEDRDEDYFLLVSALNPYKRADLAVEAFTRAGLPLVVVGEGPERERLQAMAGPTVQILGRTEDDEVRQLVSRCRAFLMPQEEDFGIAAVEAQSAGRPVIAYGAGGALETVIENETGLFFAEQTPESLLDAVHRFGRTPFDKRRIRENALRFSKERFQREYQAEVERVLGDHRAS